MILQSHPSDARSWVVFAAPASLLALPSEDAAALGGIAERVSGADGFRATLETLTAGGIASAPDFALIDGDCTVARVVLRGHASIVVTATDPDAAEFTISGAGVATWSERVLEGARSLRLQVPGSTWTVRLEHAAVEPEPEPEPEPGEPEPAPELSEPAAVTAEAAAVAPVTEPVAEVTLVPRAEIEVSSAAPQPARPESEPYDFLFGDTIYRTQSGASIRIPNPDPERPGDHDGRTMLAEELGLRGHVPEASEATAIAPIPGYVSSSGMPAPVAEPPRRVALQLECADGSRESLSEPVLIGRAPTVPKATPSGSAPRLITILDDQDISRSHLRVAVEGDAVVVTDLASKNGTVVTLPGGSPRKLRGGEPTVVLPGTLIDLGGGVTFLVRED